MSKLTRSNDHTAKFYRFEVNVVPLNFSGGYYVDGWTWAVSIDDIEHHVTHPLHQSANAAYAEALRAMVAISENMAEQARAELSELEETT